jgi:serine/threonine-protein kinase
VGYAGERKRTRTGIHVYHDHGALRSTRRFEASGAFREAGGGHRLPQFLACRVGTRYAETVSRNRGGKYRIIAHLRGGDATEASLVAIESGPAQDRGLGVLKRLKLGADAEPQLVQRLSDEAKLCKLLDHPNLARLLEAGEDDDGPILVFEYIEGPSLARLRSRAVRRGSGIPVPLTLRIVAELARGLAYAHDLKDEAGKPLKVVHRDVSPDSVTVTYDGHVKLSDFGMATTAASTARSRENRVKGNVAYMAPEQARADFSLDSRADIFALGVIMWELLTGRRLWEGQAEVDVLARLADEAPLPSARSVNESVPKEIDAICSQALTKVRDERYDSAADLLAALEKLMAKPELASSAEALGAFVTEHFDDERAKMRALVDEARSPSEGGAEKELPAIGAPRPPDQSPFGDIESDPKLRIGVALPEELPSRRVIEVVQVAPSPDRRFAYLMAALVVTVLGVVAVFAIRSPPEDKKVETKGPWVAPTRPAATDPAASAYVEPEEVTIEIRVTPEEAKLFVDGVRTPSNPHRTRVVPAKFQHSIRAEAEGYETRTMSVVFDRERSIELALVKDRDARAPVVVRKPTGTGAKAGAAATAAPATSVTAAVPTAVPVPAPAPPTE